METEFDFTKVKNKKITIENIETNKNENIFLKDEEYSIFDTFILMAFFLFMIVSTYLLFPKIMIALDEHSFFVAKMRISAIGASKIEKKAACEELILIKKKFGTFTEKMTCS